MRRCDARAAVRLRAPLQEVIAQRSRSGFYPETVYRGIGGRIAALRHAGDPEPGAQLPDESLVPVRLRAAQPVVEMRADRGNALHAVQQMQQADAVRAAAAGAEHLRARRQHIVARREFLYPLRDHSCRLSTET